MQLSACRRSHQGRFFPCLPIYREWNNLDPDIYEILIPWMPLSPSQVSARPANEMSACDVRQDTWDHPVRRPRSSDQPREPSGTTEETSSIFRRRPSVDLSVLLGMYGTRSGKDASYGRQA